MNPLDTQVDGDHYKTKTIQPVEYVHANNLGYCEGNVVKYITRWKNKNGILDLQKARHYIDLLIQLETKKQETERNEAQSAPVAEEKSYKERNGSDLFRRYRESIASELTKQQESSDYVVYCTSC